MRRLTALVACLAWGATSAPADPVTITGAADAVKDGDTFFIGPVEIRIHGIDAPEFGQRCAKPDGDTWRCGNAALRFLEDLVDGQTLNCDALDRDPYGRIISRCETAEGTDLGAAVMEAGLAWAFVKYSTDYVDSERAARDRGEGVWQAETQPPWEYRDDRWSRAVAESPDGCPIKGNISLATGEKIYHTPWSPNYASTRIDTGAGERWFCNEGEAAGAGWRAARSR